MTLRKHLRYSALVGAAVALPLAVLILWVAIGENSQLEFYDTGTGEVFWDYIILCFASIFVWFQVVGMATYWIFVLLGRAVDAWAAPRGPRNES
jgi:hypothetical protein